MLISPSNSDVVSRAENSLRSTQVWAWDFLPRIPALVLLILACPWMILLASLVALVSRRAPFVMHRRVGWQGRDLWLLKIRTMWEDSPEPSAQCCGWFVERLQESWVPDKTNGNPVVRHPLACWLRRYSVDEIPQLLHVVGGAMALVGPRPLTREELRLHYGRFIPEVLSVKPGITGLWQIRGRNRLTYRKRLRYDLFLVRNRSLPLLVKIIWNTIPVVFRGENAW